MNIIRTIFNTFSFLGGSNLLGKGYIHVSNNTSEENEIVTSNDFSQKGYLDFLLYRGLGNYVKDNQEKILESDLAINDVKKWVKSLTDSILKPIHSNGIKSLVDLENLLVETYGAGNKHFYNDSSGNEKKIRFANSFNFVGTTILRGDNINFEEGKIGNSKHNLSSGDYISTDSLGWSSMSAAPTGGYNKTQEGEKSENHGGFGLLGKVLALRPMAGEEFDQSLYEDVMNSPIKITFKGFAYESNKDEIVVMPTFSIEGKEINDLISQFSQEIPPEKIEVKTSKNFLANL